MIYPYPSLRQGLVGAWCPSLGATGYTLIDRSGYGKHAPLTGFSWSAITNGNTISGNGTTAQAPVGDYPQFRLSQTTISAWIKIGTQGTALKCFFSSYSQNTNVAGITVGINVGGASQNKLSCAIGNNTSSGPTGYNISSCAATVTDNVLHHVCVTVDSTGVIGFVVDGVSFATTKDAGTANTPMVFATVNYVTIGAEKTAAAAIGKYWPGLLDDLRVYNRVLTPAEIRLLASRRGIGLTLSGSTRATYPTKFQICVAGTWREADAYQNVGSVWKPAPPAIKVAGVWK
jgi:hypothetical protein